MNKIHQFDYDWNVSEGPVKCQDGIQPNSKFDLSNLLDEVRGYDTVPSYEVDILGHIIPCCRKDKNKKDYIEKVYNQGKLTQEQMEMVEKDVLYDSIQAASKVALTKSVHELNID